MYKRTNQILFSLLFVFLVPFSVSALDIQDNQIFVNTIDQIYSKIANAMPSIASGTNRIARKFQDIFWSRIELNLQKKVQEINNANAMIYKVLLAKVQQKKSSFQFPTSDIAFQMELVDATNRVRKENNLAPLQYSFLLSLSSYNHAKDMYDNFPQGTLSHTSSDGSTIKERVQKVGYLWSALAENVAWNQSTVKEVMDGRMNSPAHRANILSENVIELGVAKVGPYRVQNFGKPKVNK